MNRSDDIIPLKGGAAMPTVEEIIEAFKKLPPGEQQKIMDWLNEKLSKKESVESESDKDGKDGREKV